MTADEVLFGRTHEVRVRNVFAEVGLLVKVILPDSNRVLVRMVLRTVSGLAENGSFQLGTFVEGEFVPVMYLNANMPADELTIGNHGSIVTGELWLIDNYADDHSIGIMEVFQPHEVY
jgi:hypothetical protein